MVSRLIIYLISFERDLGDDIVLGVFVRHFEISRAAAE